jgi:hypothetical protein
MLFFAISPLSLLSLCTKVQGRGVRKRQQTYRKKQGKTRAESDCRIIRIHIHLHTQLLVMPPKKATSSKAAEPAHDFKTGETVLCKVKGYPEWPGKVHF